MRPLLRSSARKDASVEAPPSLLPQKRYCDVTGLEVRSFFVPPRFPRKLTSSIPLLPPLLTASYFVFPPARLFMLLLAKQAKYLDPKSTLRYHNPEIYEALKKFQPAVIQAYLAVRGMGVVLT